MDRIHAVENMAFTILDEIGDDVEKMEAVAHLTAVAKFSYLLALAGILILNLRISQASCLIFMPSPMRGRTMHCMVLFSHQGY